MNLLAASIAATLAASGAPIQPTLPIDSGALVARLPWNECVSGPPDWREPRPLLVLSDDLEGDSYALPMLAGTAFALYKDGTVFTRRLDHNQIGLDRSTLSRRRIDRLTASLDVPALLRLPEVFVIPDPPGQGRPSHGYERVTLLLWVEGCRRTITVNNLSALGLDFLEGAAEGPVAREVRARTQAALATLPPILASALRALATFRPARARRFCTGAACFDRARTLPNQVAWLE